MGTVRSFSVIVAAGNRKITEKLRPQAFPPQAFPPQAFPRQGGHALEVERPAHQKSLLPHVSQGAPEELSERMLFFRFAPQFFDFFARPFL